MKDAESDQMMEAIEQLVLESEKMEQDYSNSMEDLQDMLAEIVLFKGNRRLKMTLDRASKETNDLIEAHETEMAVALMYMKRKKHFRTVLISSKCTLWPSLIGRRSRASSKPTAREYRPSNCHCSNRC
jgi:hypothetical protein